MTTIDRIEKIRETEFDKLFSALNSTQDFRLRMWIFLGTVNLAAVSAGFTSQKPVIILIASLLMPLFILADVSLLKNIYSYYYRGKRILSSMNYDGSNLFDMFIQMYNPRVRKALAEIIAMEDEGKALGKIRRLPYTSPTMIGFFAPVTAFIAEAVYGIVHLDSTFM